jgi:hypothetical protein
MNYAYQVKNFDSIRYRAYAHLITSLKHVFPSAYAYSDYFSAKDGAVTVEYNVDWDKVTATPTIFVL